jgi:hypothetical protein
LGELRNFLQPAIPAKWTGLVAGAAKFESDKVVIEMHYRFDFCDLPAKVTGAKNISGRRDTRWGRIQRRPRCLRRGNRGNDQQHQADHDWSACNVVK